MDYLSYKWDGFVINLRRPFRSQDWYRNANTTLKRNKSQKRTQSLRYRDKGAKCKRERPLSVAAFTQTEATHATLRPHHELDTGTYRPQEDLTEITFARPVARSHDLFSIDERYLFDLDSDQRADTPTLQERDARRTSTRPPSSPAASRRSNSLPGNHARHNRYRRPLDMPSATSTPASPSQGFSQAPHLLNRTLSGEHSLKLTSSPLNSRNRSDSDAVSDVPSSSGSSNGLEYTVVTIVLPDEREYQLSCESSKPMMDVLIQITSENKLSPTDYVLQEMSEKKGWLCNYIASQPIGQCKSDTLYLISKAEKKKKEAIKPKVSHQFAVTNRFLVNLPHQKTLVLRLSQRTSLADIYQLVCEQKRLDVYKHEFRHPVHPDKGLNMAASIGELGLTSITLVNVTGESTCDQRYTNNDSATMGKSDSLSRVEANTDRMTYMPSEGGKKKKGFFSFFRSKKGSTKFKPTSLGDEAVPVRRTHSDAVKARPLTIATDVPPQHSPPPPSNTANGSIHNISENIKPSVAANVAPAAQPNKPSRKKRAAPLPPGAPINPASEGSCISEPCKSIISSQSSHSSGFEEQAKKGKRKAPVIPMPVDNVQAPASPSEPTTLVSALEIETVSGDKVDCESSSPAKPSITRQDSVTSSKDAAVSDALEAAAPASLEDTPISRQDTPLDGDDTPLDDYEEEMPVSPRLDNDSAIGGSTGVDDNDSLLGSHGHSPVALRPATFHAPPPPCETPPELSPRTDYLDLQNSSESVQSVLNNGKDESNNENISNNIPLEKEDVKISEEFNMADSGIPEDVVIKHAPLEPVFSLPSESDVSPSVSANQSSVFLEEEETKTESVVSEEECRNEVFEEVIIPKKKNNKVESTPPMTTTSRHLPSHHEPSDETHNHEQENAIEEVLVVPSTPVQELTRQPPVETITESMRSPTLTRHTNVEKTLSDSVVEQPKENSPKVEVSVEPEIQKVPKVEAKKEKEVFILTKEDVRKARASESEYKRTTIKIATPKHPLDRKTGRLNSSDSTLERTNSSSQSKSSSVSSFTSISSVTNNNNNNNNNSPTNSKIVKEVEKVDEVKPLNKTDDATLFTVPSVPRHQTSSPATPISTSLRLDFRSSSPIQRSTDDIGPLSPPSLAGVSTQARGVRRAQSQLASSASRFNGPKGWGVSRAADPAVKDFRGSLYTKREHSSINNTSCVAPVTTSTPIAESTSTTQRKVERSDSLKGASRRTCSAKNQQRAEWSKNARRYTSLVSLNESAIHTARQLSNQDDAATTAMKTGSSDQLAQRSPQTPPTDSSSPTKESAAKSLQLQYTDLQKQFGKWQSQLADNQRVVSEQLAVKEATTTTTAGSASRASNEQNAGSPISPLAGECDGYRPTSSQKTFRQRDLSKLDVATANSSVPTTSAALAGKFSPDELSAKKQILRANARPANTVRFQARTRAGSPPHDILLCRSMDASSNKSSTSSASSSPPPPAAPSSTSSPQPTKTTSPLSPNLPAAPEPSPLKNVSQRKYKQLDPLKLDPREELMLAIRNSSLKKLKNQSDS